MSQAPPLVAELIETFERNLSSYKSHGYNEANLRQAFINPFFEALGWDVANKQGHASIATQSCGRRRMGYPPSYF